MGTAHQFSRPVLQPPKIPVGDAHPTLPPKAGGDGERKTAIFGEKQIFCGKSCLDSACEMRVDYAVQILVSRCGRGQSPSLIGKHPRIGKGRSDGGLQGNL